MKGKTTFIPAQEFHRWAGDDASRWRALDTCRVRMPGRGFGDVVRVDDGSTIWIQFDIAMDETDANATVLESVTRKAFAGDEIAQIVVSADNPPGELNELVESFGQRSPTPKSLNELAAEIAATKAVQEATRKQAGARDAEEKRKHNVKSQATAKRKQEKKIETETKYKRDSQKRNKPERKREEIWATAVATARNRTEELWLEQHLRTVREKAAVATRRDVKARRAETTAHKRTEQERAAAARTLQIKKVCNAQQIDHLVHFTRIENLRSILQHGLVSRARVDLWRAQNGSSHPLVCDEYRWDGNRHTICLSISFPNYQMFFSQRDRLQGEWVVLQLDAAILWELDCAFCWTNAASNVVKQVGIHSLKSPEALRALFRDSEGSRLKYNLPPHYTTDPQAEILVFDHIPLDYIRAVCFRGGVPNEYAQSAQVHTGIEFIQHNGLFRRRSDFKYWQKNGETTI